MSEAHDQEPFDRLAGLPLPDLDPAGAVEEAFSAVQIGSRRSFLAKAGGAAAALCGGLALPSTASAAAASDVAILNFALTLEYLQASFYTETERMGAIGARLAPIPRQLGAVERAHVKALKDVLGSKAVKRPSFNFQGTTEEGTRFLKTAVAFEDLAVAAYKGQAARIESPALLAAAVSIHSVEARHAAWMRHLVGILPAASAFDRPKNEPAVRAIVASTHFITAKAKSTRKRPPRFTG